MDKKILCQQKTHYICYISNDFCEFPPGENLRKFTETRARGPRAPCSCFFVTKNIVRMHDSNDDYPQTFGTSTGMRKCTRIPRISRMYIISQLPRSYAALKNTTHPNKFKKGVFARRKMAREWKRRVFNGNFRGCGPIVSPSSRGCCPPTHPV